MTASQAVRGCCVLILAWGIARFAPAQDHPGAPAQTMRPVVRGRVAAVSSMKAEATKAARRILEEGGNAFDAAVGGQAALAVTDFPSNGVGADAVLLVYLASQKNRLLRFWKNFLALRQPLRSGSARHPRAIRRMLSRKTSRRS